MILRRHLLTEWIQPTLMTLVLFTFVLLVGNLVKLADLFVNRGVSPLAVLQLFVLLLPSLMSYTVPMAVLTGTLLAFGKLSGDREIIAMRACGVSYPFIAFPVLAAGLLASALLVPMNTTLVPWSHFEARRVGIDIAIRNPTAFLEAGTFIKEFHPYILFVYHVDGNQMQKIRIYETDNRKPTRTIVAESGEFIPLPEQRRVLLKLRNGTADEPDPKDASKFYKLKFETYTLNMGVGDKDPRSISMKPKDMDLGQMRKTIAELEQNYIIPAPLYVEMHRRIAMAFSPVVFALMAFPLAITTRRAQKSIGFGMSILIFLGYYLFLAIGQALSEKGLSSAIFAMWLGNGVFSVAGLLLFWKLCRR